MAERGEATANVTTARIYPEIAARDQRVTRSEA